MNAKARVTAQLLRQARVLRGSKDPREAIAAAEWEIRLQKELDDLEKEQQRELKLVDIQEQREEELRAAERANG